MLYRERFKGFKPHPKIEGTHAFLSPSSPAWLRYTPERLLERLAERGAAERGTRLHETAARNIYDGIMLREDGKYPILAAYVNHAIEFGMVPEQMLYYSLECYGTADAISFEPYIDNDEFSGFLRIHDLKTGVSKCSMDQLYVYAALFCLEYDFRPFEIEGELRIYQGDIIYEEIDRFYLASVYSAIRDSVEIIGEHSRTGGLA